MATFVCRHCSTSLNTSLEKAIDHVHSHRLSAKPCVVPECGQWASKLTRHVKTSHPSLCRSFCNLCGRAFVKERSLKQHQQDTIDCTIKKQRKRGNKPRNKKQDTVTFTPSCKKYNHLAWTAQNYIYTIFVLDYVPLIRWYENIKKVLAIVDCY